MAFRYHAWSIRYASKQDNEFYADAAIKARSVEEDDDLEVLRDPDCCVVDDEAGHAAMEGDIPANLFSHPVKLGTGHRSELLPYYTFTVMKPEAAVAPEKPAVLDAIKPIDYHTAKMYGWNRKSPGFLVSIDNTFAFRDGTPGTSNAIRGPIGFSKGIHHWLIRWDPSEYGMHPVIGVGTASAPLVTTGYTSAIGINTLSYGWHLGVLGLLHYSRRNRPAAYPGKEFRTKGGHYQPPEEISVILDMDSGTLSFMAKGVYLGTAFTGLKGKTLYPMVSTTWKFAKIQIRHVGSLYSGPPRTLLSQAAARLSEPERDELQRNYDMPSQVFDH